VTIAGRTKRFCSPQRKARANAARRAAKTAGDVDRLELVDRVRVQLLPDPPEPVPEFCERPFCVIDKEPEPPEVAALLRPPALPSEL
jgi:hypothetical protein